MNDPRARVAQFYDLAPDMPGDVPFYVSRLPRSGADVLELGCGTGRVTVPLAKHCASLHGIDHSTGMLRICREKVVTAGVRNVVVEAGDVSAFHLDRTFDLIIAPYRVLQNLESDAEVQGLFAGVREHLGPEGRCILNTFRPQGSPEEIIARWSTADESLDWEVATEDGRIACYARRSGVQAHPLVLRPELFYRVYRGNRLIEEQSLRFAMRCYYPEELLALVRREGFEITATFGGYAGEPYGEGPELVVEFALQG